MKNLRLTAILLLSLSGISISASAQLSLKFIDGIQFSNEPVYASVSKVSYSNVMPEASLPIPAISKTSFSSLATEACNMLQFKYSQLINTEIELVNNFRLFEFIEEWWSVAYRFGGTTKRGIDCSAFSGLLMSSVFGVALPRTAREQYKASKKILLADAREGDLLFFNTRGGVSHVGIYLANNYFVHASSSNGVTISDLTDSYYAKRFIGAAKAGGNDPQL
jgi:lipoprotein Spr